MTGCNELTRITRNNFILSSNNLSFHIITLGCKTNIYESESIFNALITKGLILQKDRTKSNIIIINSCTVTSKADAKTRNIIRRSRNENKTSLLIVCGCLVNTDIDELLKMDYVDIFLENKDKDKIPEIINLYFSDHITAKPYVHKNIHDGTFNFNASRMSKHSRAFLKIQDGCNNRCSYCKIPLARGKSRSRDINEIYKELDQFIENKYEEVVLTGINIGSYNYNKINFTNLMKSLTIKYSQIRFRISSLEPEYIDADFCEVFKNKNICPHIHLPLQNGSDKILKLMNRKYSTDDFFKKIEMLKESKNNLFISSDLILGFPSETDNDFNNTLNFIKKIDFSFIHLFGYSPREKTEAYYLKPRVPERIRDERVKTIKSKVLEMNYNYRKRNLGKTLEVVIEQEKKDHYTGKSENYIDFKILKKHKLETKKRYKIKFTEITDTGNYGTIIFHQQEPELH